MAKHIFISTNPEAILYTSPNRGGGREGAPDRDRILHAQYLQNKLKGIWEKVKTSDEERLAVALPVKGGTYLEFKSSPDYDLNLMSLEDRRSGVKLLNARTEKNEGKLVNKATIYIPKGKENHFMKKIQEYGYEDTKKGNPKNQDLIATIEDMNVALLEAFWIGDKQYMPDQDPYWCELWIRDEGEGIIETVRSTLKRLNIEIREGGIEFPERTIMLIKANKEQLAALIAESEFIAEIRRATEANAFFLDLDNKEQLEWARDLIERVERKESNVVVSVLDTGLNNGNILLSPVIADEDIHSHFSNDTGNDLQGHGTAMGGISAYGDIKGALESGTGVVVSHSLESMKILQDGRENEPELFGAITVQSVSHLYIEEPERTRIICMAVTAKDYSSLNGHPSSWSAAIDDLVHGTMDGIQKVFIVSAGNIRGAQEVYNYPESSLVETVEDPAQSWNAITVGAYTNLDTPEDPSYEIIAQKGELSPFSRSSILFDKTWPIKPEIVLEGGNAVKSGEGGFEDAGLSILTTSHDPTNSTFTTMNATSAASAKAAWMAAKIQTAYPDAWPETVRALLIHSAEWTQEMKQQFLASGRKTDYRNLLRTCGYGVPSLERAIETANNRVNLIVQSELQPFDKKNSSYKTNEMHIHELPWPREELLEMADAEVEMKVTLSYFIEPGPGEKGWKNRYRYPSSGLRFDLNGTNDKDSFLTRINRAVRDEEEEGNGLSSGVKWKLGINNRNVGSIHSDTWIGTAADLATSNYIGIYPVIGWWRERHHLGKWKNKVRYSLIVTLSVPEVDVDLLTPIQNAITAKIASEVRIDI